MIWYLRIFVVIIHGNQVKYSQTKVLYTPPAYNMVFKNLCRNYSQETKLNIQILNCYIRSQTTIWYLMIIKYLK